MRSAFTVRSGDLCLALLFGMPQAPASYLSLLSSSSARMALSQTMEAAKQQLTQGTPCRRSLSLERRMTSVRSSATSSQKLAFQHSKGLRRARSCRKMY